MKTEMTNTTIKRGEKYGVYLNDIISWGAEYGYKFSRIIHVKKTYSIKPWDSIIFTDNSGSEATVSLEVGNCPMCGEECISFGWEEGGVHSSTCRCQTIDFS